MSRHRVLQGLRLNVDGPCLRAVDYASQHGYDDVDSIMHKAYDSHCVYAMCRERPFGFG